jgi:hypothetical protein
MLYDWLFIILGLILTIGFAIYITRERYTKGDTGEFIILDKEGVPNIIDKEYVNKSMDKNFKLLNDALEGPRIPVTIVETRPRECKRGEHKRHRGSGRCDTAAAGESREPCRNIVQCTWGTQAFRIDGRSCTCVYGKQAGWAHSMPRFDPV